MLFAHYFASKILDTHCESCLRVVMIYTPHACIMLQNATVCKGQFITGHEKSFAFWNVSKNE